MIHRSTDDAKSLHLNQCIKVIDIAGSEFPPGSLAGQESPPCRISGATERCHQADAGHKYVTAGVVVRERKQVEFQKLGVRRIPCSAGRVSGPVRFCAGERHAARPAAHSLVFPMEGFRSDWIVVSWIRWLWDGGHELGDGSFDRSDSEACSEMPTSEPVPTVSSLSMRCTVAASAENDNAPTDHFVLGRSGVGICLSRYNVRGRARNYCVSGTGSFD